MSKLKLISAEDTQFPAALLKSIGEQRNQGLFCDVTIIVQDRKFKAHKTVLSASSSYFRQLFSVAGQVIELNFIKADIFEEILNYIYSSKIFRVRSDKLEDLINAGQVLGVKFIANLGVPLAQVKGLPGLSKDGDNNSANSSEKPETNMPIIAESFSLSAEEFNMGGGGLEKEVNSDDDDDIVFVSKTDAPQPQKNKISENNNAESEEGPQAKKQKVAEEGHNPSDGKRNLANNTQRPIPKIVIPIESSSCVPTLPIRDDSNTESSSASLTSDSNCTSPSLENNEVIGVQKKKVLPDTPSLIRLSDVRQTCKTNNERGGSVNAVPAAVSAKKTITLDKASEIDSLSPGCKVYANIGENTYDIVPVKDDPGEGVAPGRKSETLLDVESMITRSPRGRKKLKLDQEDHYEIIMDGKTFFVCTVCKRPYVCLTSLRRHYNTHSWEKKYPCHYCDKVFALAEYRTKHEITHTGERRYQCLLCHETFLNYQVLSTHCKHAHNQDPSGRKEKDDSCNNLYRLLPCKTLQMKNYSYLPENSEMMPLIMDDGTVQHGIPGKEHFPNQENQELPSSQDKTLTWDDIFAESESQTRPPPVADVQVEPPPRPVNQRNPESTSEFEFVIPETY